MLPRWHSSLTGDATRGSSFASSEATRANHRRSNESAHKERAHRRTKAPKFSERFKRAVQRVGGKAYWLDVYQTALAQMAGVRPIGLDFFRVAENAIKADRLVRLIRVLEVSDRPANFWYLRRVQPKLMTNAAVASGLDLPGLESVASRLMPIRNGTLMHLDKHGIMDTAALYRDAGLKQREIADSVRGLHKTMLEVYTKVFGQPPDFASYDGLDIKALEALRDAQMARSARRLGER